MNGIPIMMLFRDPSCLNKDLASPNPVENVVEHARIGNNSLPMCNGDININNDTNLRGDEFRTDGQQPANSLGLHLLKNWVFLLFLVATALCSVTQESLHWFIPGRAIEVGLSHYDAALSMVIANVFNLCGRLTFGCFSPNVFYYKTIIFTLYAFISGINSVLVVWIKSYWPYMISSGVYGLLRGLYIICQLTLAVDIVGKEQWHLAYGITMTTSGLVYLVSIPLFGYLNESTKSYAATFATYGGLEIVGGLIFLPVPVHLLRKGHNYCKQWH